MTTKAKKKPVFIQKKNTIPRPICIQTAPEEEQNVYYRGWKKVLNSFGSNVEFALTFNNRSINMNDFFESVLIKETGDEFDHLRKQMNTIIVDRMQDGRNGIQKDKYLTVAVHTDKPKKAGEVFRRLDRDIHKSLVKIGSFAKVIPLEERLEILFALYNDSDEHLIAPSSFDIKPEQIQMGNKFARTLRVTNLPSQLNDEFINSATDMPFNCLTTMNYKAIPTREADSIVAKNLSLVRDAKTRQMQAGQKQGVYDDSYVQPELLDREAEALSLRDDMRQKDEHLFETTLTVTIFADTEEQLDEYTETLITEYKKASVVIEIMTDQQEEGFNSTLPLCYNQVACKRTLKTSSAAIFVPFSTLELNDPNGINYSCNLLSKNLLVYDRLLSSNFNGFILGTPGAGKSFSAKVEMMSVFLKTNSDIIVIDPEDEYTALAKLLGGEIIKVVPGGENHINPL